MTTRLGNFAKRLRREATRPEEFLWSELRNRRFGGYKFKRQVPIGGYVVDFLCEEVGVVVEVDGRQHEGLVDYDAQRSMIIRSYGFEVVRFTNGGIMDHPEPSLARLRALLEAARQAKQRASR
ncbi:MAG: endonuclease domain-containing protein [Phreatobacter sp.]